MISRPALRYHGGKFRAAAWIISHFPAHECYTEAFGGAASVLLQKIPVRHEVYNDADSYLVGFFRVLREQTQALIDAIRWTPYSRAELRAAWADFGEAGTLEAARRLYVRSYQSFSNAPAHATTGWRFNRSGLASAVRQFNAVDSLYDIAERLRQVQFECRDGLAVLRDFDAPNTLHYVDPPYVDATRTSKSTNTGHSYVHEMDDGDHAELLAVCRELRGAVVLSGYDSALYRAALPDWARVSRRFSALSGTSRVECLWLSPSVTRTTQPYLLPLTEADHA